MQLRAATICNLILLVCLGSINGGDLASEFEFQGVAQSPPRVVDARTKADAAYQQSDYPKVIDLTTMLIDNYPNDNVHVAYHLRASAKIEIGRNSASAKQVRDGIADARQAIQLAGNEYPWVNIP